MSEIILTTPEEIRAFYAEEIGPDVRHQIGSARLYSIVRWSANRREVGLYHAAPPIPPDDCVILTRPVDWTEADGDCETDRWEIWYRWNDKEEAGGRVSP